MKTGLVIGKFMPVHAGHLALIEFAARNCDSLIVSMSYTEQDPIPAELRFQWLSALTRDKPNVKVVKVLDDFDQPQLDLEARTKVWAQFIKKTFLQTDTIFSSEDYGALLGKHLNIEHKTFDVERKQVPVSATLIREQPFRYWSFIPELVRPYFVKRICLNGPESTGKSVMTKNIADHFNTSFVPEVAREMITSNEFSVEDIIRIGQAHYERIISETTHANKILICDTDAITTQIYAEHYLGTIPPILFEFEKKVSFQQYFLFDVDVPWVADGLRDLGHARQQMFETFKQQLELRGIDYILVQGDWETRKKIVIDHIMKIWR